MVSVGALVVSARALVVSAFVTVPVGALVVSVPDGDVMRLGLVVIATGNCHAGVDSNGKYDGGRGDGADAGGEKEHGFGLRCDGGSGVLRFPPSVAHRLCPEVGGPNLDGCLISTAGYPEPRDARWF